MIAGFDTDCNGATVGSILGLMLGESALPKKWIDPLQDRLRCGLSGMDTVSISELARRTAQQASAIPGDI